MAALVVIVSDLMVVAVKLWSTAYGEPVRVVCDVAEDLTCGEVSPDGARVVTVVLLWDSDATQE